MTSVTRRQRGRASLIAFALAVGLGSAASARAQQFPPMCAQGWEATTIVEGVGELENLDSDGSGGFYVTGIQDGFLAHIAADGTFRTLLTGLDHPAGVRVVDRFVYFLTGDGLDAAGPGTLQRYDLDTASVTVLRTGLDSPNGLLVLPDGDLVFSVMGLKGGTAGIARYRPATGEFTPVWSPLPLPNGLALAPDGVSIYADNMTLRVFRIPLDDPGHPVPVAGIPDLIAVPDDMEATRTGDLFLADHAVGAVYRIDPETGESCAIISGLIRRPDPIRIPPDGATSVRIARDGGSWALFVTGMDGVLRRLRAPADVDLTPADPRRR
ncbi:SMP-30/gluconolactonase/LRE family protein [Nocardia paucivorans]|uniref:SMP-30/gluconolactonase/LRE family protein n=1 Tax=Nocardia paucivorans TaxID=114259 RepID=UPI00031BB44E|nr:SMP-30/gluconolactonase/LRE family protein [Nocardia paucivorans]